VHPGQRVSDAMKNQFTLVSEAKPGDLLFYRGAEKESIGNFVMMYIGPGKEGGHGICLGIYDTGKPIEVIDSYFFDKVSPPDHFLGYYRPDYAD
jgi:cell wall-associated NlpC family hydrolase